MRVTFTVCKHTLKLEGHLYLAPCVFGASSCTFLTHLCIIYVEHISATWKQIQTTHSWAISCSSSKCCPFPYSGQEPLWKFGMSDHILWCADQVIILSIHFVSCFLIAEALEIQSLCMFVYLFAYASAPDVFVCLHLAIHVSCVYTYHKKQ